MKRLLVLLVTLEVVDGLATGWATTHGLAAEANPLLAPLVGNGNLLLLKVVGAAASALALWALYRRFPRAALACANSIVLFYGLVLGWNFTALFAF